MITDPRAGDHPELARRESVVHTVSNAVRMIGSVGARAQRGWK
jgi:hypothetical protein